MEILNFQADFSSVMICSPNVVMKCSPVMMTQVDLVVKEKCVTIHKTICTQVQQSVSLPACNIKYVPELVLTEATVLEVIMVKQCITQLVMVCTVQEDGVDDGKG